MRVIITVGWICLYAIPSMAQINFSKYFDENSIPLYSFDDHLNVKFNWDMKGKVQVHMNEGLNYLDEENLELAISNFDKAIELDSTLYASHYYRGICHKKLLKYKEAIKDLKTAMQLNPAQAETYIELGEIYQLQNDLSQASSWYEKAIAVNPNIVQGHFNLGTVELRKGETKKALRLFQRCNEVDPGFPDAYILQGILRFKESRKNKESIAFFDRAVKADSSYSQTYFWRGLMFTVMEQNEKCLVDWTRFIALNPGNAFMLMMRGFLFIELNRFDEAFTDLRKAFLSQTLNEDKFQGAQTILDKQIDLQAATHYLIRNGYGLKEETFAHLKKGYCLLLADRRKEALENLKKAEQSEPSAAVFFLQAITYEHLNEHLSAFQCYNKTLELDNDIFDAHKKRSVYLCELKEWKAANSDFNDMIRLQPQSMIPYRLRGLAKSVQHDFAGAIIDLTKFIKSDSSDFESLRTRAICRAQLGDEKGSNEDMRMMISIDPNNWQLYEDVARNYLALKDTASAIEVLKEYAQERSSVFIPYLQLARIYVAQKKWDDAREQIKLLLPYYIRNGILNNIPRFYVWRVRSITIILHMTRLSANSLRRSKRTGITWMLNISGQRHIKKADR